MEAIVYIKIAVYERLCVSTELRFSYLCSLVKRHSVRFGSKSTRILSFFLGWYTPKWGRYVPTKFVWSQIFLRNDFSMIVIENLLHESKILFLHNWVFIYGSTCRLKAFHSIHSATGKILEVVSEGQWSFPASVFILFHTILHDLQEPAILSRNSGLFSWFVRTNTLRPRPSSKGLPRGGGVLLLAPGCRRGIVLKVEVVWTRDEQWGSPVVEDLGLESRDFYRFFVAIETGISKYYPTKVQPLAPRRVSGMGPLRDSWTLCSAGTSRPTSSKPPLLYQVWESFRLSEIGAGVLVQPLVSEFLLGGLGSHPILLAMEWLLWSSIMT